MLATKPSVIATEAAQAAAAAAKNACKPGVRTSEFWVTVLGAAGAVVAAALLPTPFGPVAAAAVGAAALGYSRSRGDVKAAALSAFKGALQEFGGADSSSDDGSGER